MEAACAAPRVAACTPGWTQTICAPDPPCRLLDSTVLGLSVTGWVAGGFTTTSDDPRDPPQGMGNLPVAFNYRSNDYQLNQLYVIIQRPTDTDGCGFDIGGRVDLLYGEDYIFTQAAGLETTPEGRNRWNAATGGGGIGGTARLGLAMPQVYGEVAWRRLKVKLGRFYTTIGYDGVMAPDNFFYSRSYALVYGEPFTHTGGLFTWQINDQWSAHAGLVNGWDKFDAVNDRAALLAGFAWTSPSGCTTFRFAFITGDEDGTAPPNLGNRTMYSMVFSHYLTDRLQYVLQHDFGNQNGGDVFSPFAGGRDAKWYGLNQCVFYTLNDRWKLGLRYEWFNDQNGTRVIPFGGHWNQLALGMNWTPSPNIIVRPEARWDWFAPHHPATPAGPFDELTDRNQFTGGFDLIVLF
ncbi:MAG TPA: porin [Planctomycetes bacterium]|nr:porin [Planctomycetota bacterium]